MPTSKNASSTSNDPGAPPAPGGSILLAGHPVARIGFGAMQLAGGHGRPAPAPETAVAVLRSAVEQGVNHIDTAQFYSEGRCNELIREALAPYPETLALVSKVGARSDGAGRLVTGQRPEELRAQVEENLAALGTERLAVVNLRRADAPPGIVAEGDQIVDLDSQLAEMVALRDEGKIGGIGLSAVTAEQVHKAQPAQIVCVQNWYSVLDRSHQDVLDACREHGIAWAPFFPLGSAFPSVPKVTDHPAVIEIAAAYEITPAQVGLAWLLATYERTLIIAGTLDPAHLAENVRAGAVQLAPETLDTLTALA